MEIFLGKKQPMVIDKNDIFLCDGGSLEQMLGFLSDSPFHLEAQTFAMPRVLSGNLTDILARYKESIEKIGPKRILVHGPFIDVTVASPDPDIAEISKKRFRQGLDCAVFLGAEAITFHTQYNTQLRLDAYIAEWLNNTGAFYREVLQEPSYKDIKIYVENMFEDSPDLMLELMKMADSPRFGVTLDVGHVNVYGKAEYTRWIRMLAPYIRHIHLSDNEGLVDRHKPLGAGTVDFGRIFSDLNSYGIKPTYTVEMNNEMDLRESIDFLERFPAL